MIGKVTGRVGYVADDHALIEANGVGYLIYCSPQTLARLPRAGGAAALYTDLVVREDLLQLYGFATLMEKEWHRLLTSVQGVGAKVSLAILGALGPEGVSRAIALGDATAIKRAPGVGPKLAARIANELRDKAPNVMALGAAAAKAATPDEGVAAYDDEPLVEAYESDAAAESQADAVSALVNLGYQSHEAATAVARATDAAGAEADAALLIKHALKLLAAKG